MFWTQRNFKRWRGRRFSCEEESFLLLVPESPRHRALPWCLEVSQSRELDAIVLTLHKSNEQLRARATAREAALKAAQDAVTQLQFRRGQEDGEDTVWIPKTI